MKKLRQKSIDSLENMAINSTRWIGSINSILVHTAIFIISFVLYFFGINFDKILLVVTTIVSLEAIYLAIFIQMSVNRNAAQLKEVALDIDEIQEDIEEDEKEEAEYDEMMERIEDTLGKLAQELIELKKQHIDKK